MEVTSGEYKEVKDSEKSVGRLDRVKEFRSESVLTKAQNLLRINSRGNEPPVS